MNDKRTPERKALDDDIREEVEAEGTAYSRMSEEEQARVRLAARIKKRIAEDPGPMKVRGFRIPNDLYGRMEKASKEAGARNVSAWLRAVIEEILDS